MIASLIDIGANLTHDSFDHDRDEVIATARSAGVEQMIVTGASREGSDKSLELARQYPGTLFATAGVHPHRATDYDAATHAHFRTLLDKPEVVAAGEMGLDYFRDFSPRDDQKKAFEAQLELAIEANKPCFLHQRDAHDDFMQILKPCRDQLGDVVVHCFTGQQHEMHDYLDLDCHIGITGWLCDERRGAHLKTFVDEIPADRLMVETDSPYLKPRSLRPRVKSHRNEPQWLPWIVGTLAACRGEHPDTTARTTTATARRFFRLPEVAAADVDARLATN